MTDPNKNPLDCLPQPLRGLVEALLEGPRTVRALDGLVQAHFRYPGETRCNEALRVLWEYLGPDCVRLTEIPHGLMQWHNPIVTLTQPGREQVRYYLEAIDD